MRFEDVKDIRIEEKEGDLLPVRVTLVRENYHSNKESKVHAGGKTLQEAIVTLFSTAGLGRFAPSTLAEILEKKLREKINHFVLDDIIACLVI